jgi:TRAP-type C4-dicarboxylate transport system substrate-binding protein
MKRAVCSAVVLSLAVLLSGALQLTGAQDKIVWRLGYLSVPKSGYQAMIDALPDRLGKLTGGRLEIQTSATIVAPLQHLAALRDGRLEAVAAVLPYYSGEAPVLNVGGLPGLFQSFEEYTKATDTFLFEAYDKIYREKYNGVHLAHGNWPGQVIFSKQPIRTLADFKGTKIRAHNLETSQLMAKLGAKPIAMPFAEFFPAIQRGVVDAGMTGTTPGFGIGLYQVTKYINDWRIGYTVAWSVIVNTKTWDSLPADLKPKLVAEFKKIQAEYAAAVGEETKKGLDLNREKGMEVINPDPAELAKSRDPKLLREIWDGWIDLNKKQGFDGKSLLDGVQKVLKQS